MLHFECSSYLESMFANVTLSLTKQQLSMDSGDKCRKLTIYKMVVYRVGRLANNISLDVIHMRKLRQ